MRLNSLLSPNRPALIALAVGSGLLAGAGAGVGAQGNTALAFWHTRRGDQEKALQAVCQEYGRVSPGVAVEPQFQGSYDDLAKKVRAALLSHSPPALAVAYEPNVVEYMANNGVRPLDSLVNHPKLGFSKQELADFHPVYLASNRYTQYKGQLLSFPFTKSNLVLYYNRTLLQKAGFQQPPATWEEFEKQSAAITRQMGQPAYALDLDPSTLDALVYSHGGAPLDRTGTKSQFDQPPTRKALELLGRMAAAKTLRVVTPNEIGPLFASQRCAFAFSTSAALAYTDDLVKGRFDWDVAIPPHAAGVKPVTVMYGPNVCIFRSTPQQEQEAWKFIKWFVSPAVTARWARETGYLPLRKSAASLPEMRDYYRKNPRALRVYQMLPAARPEPNVLGWQEVRKLLSDAARTVAASGTPAAAAAVELKRKADAALAASR